MADGALKTASEAPVRSSCVAGRQTKGVLVALEPSELCALDWTGVAYPALAFTPEQIIAAAVKLPDWLEFPDNMDGPGIYFLQRRGKICYVGLAKYLGLRVGDHYRQNRPFDAVTVIYGVHRDAMSDLEAAYLMAWSPPWNVKFLAGWSPAYATLTEKLAAMPLDLICDQPEHQYRGRSVDEIAKALG